MSPAPLPTVLLLDTDASRLGASAEALSGEADCLSATDCGQAADLMRENFVQVVVADAGILESRADAFLAAARERWPETVWIACTAPGAGTPEGIHHVLPKPCPDDHLRLAVRNGVRLFRLARDNDRLQLEMRCLSRPAETRLESQRAALMSSPGFDAVLRDPGSPLGPIVEAARQIATFDVPVLLTGEPGTGRRQIARAMHDVSLRSDRALAELNCAGLSDDVIELELFGARNGSVPTGQKSKIGLVQKADRGTLYLEGLETLSGRLQLRLLRLLTERNFQPVGGHEPVTTNVRLIAAASPALAEKVSAAAFSSALYHAVAVTEIALPPLRQRRMDVPLLAQQALFDAAARHGKPVHGFTDAALGFLAAYDWPGNLRELKNEVTRMLIFAQGRTLGPDLISRHILQADPAAQHEDHTAETIMAGDGTLKDRVEHIEARILRETLTRHKWNKSRAAAELGLSRVGLRAKLDRYGVAPSETTRELEEG